MKGGLEGSQEELLFVDNKMYPRRKIETIKKLMEELSEDDLREYLIQDILKPRGKRAKRIKPVHQEAHSAHSDVLEKFDKMIADLSPVNKVVDFRSPAQKEFAVSEAIKVAKRGRPKIYHTEEERKQAKTKKTVASNIRKELERKVQQEEEKEAKPDDVIFYRKVKKAKKTPEIAFVNGAIHEVETPGKDDDFPLNKILEPLGPAQAIKRKLAEANITDPVERYMKAHNVSREVATEMVKKFGIVEGKGIKKIVKSKLGEKVRGAIVAEYIKKHNVPLGEASRMVKKLGLY